MEVKSIDTICQQENHSSGLENICLYCELQILMSVNQKVSAAECFLTVKKKIIRHLKLFSSFQTLQEVHRNDHILKTLNNSLKMQF